MFKNVLNGLHSNQRLTPTYIQFDAVQSETHGYCLVLGYGRDAADVAMVTQFGNPTLESLEVETELPEG